MKRLTILVTTTSAVFLGACAQTKISSPQQATALVQTVVMEQATDKIIAASKALAKSPPPEATSESPEKKTKDKDNTEEILLPVVFDDSRLELGDIIKKSAFTLPISEDLGPTEPVSTESDNLLAFERVFSVHDFIREYPYLNLKSREKLAGYFREYFSEAMMFDVDASLSSGEVKMIAEVSDVEGIGEASTWFNSHRSRMLLKLASGYEEASQEELNELMTKLGRDQVSELRLNYDGSYKKSNNPTLRKNVGIAYKNLKRQMESGEEFYVVAKIAFADVINSRFAKESSDVDNSLQSLETLSRALFTNFDDLQATWNKEEQVVDLTRNPRIYWGYQAYPIKLDEKGNLVIDDGDSIMLDENLEETAS